MTANFAFSQAAYYVDENIGTPGFTVTVTRTGDITESVTVNYATSDLHDAAIAGTDYIATSGTLTFEADVTTQTFTVPILDNDVINPSKFLNLTLSDPIQGRTLQTVTLTIDDDDFDGIRDDGRGSSTTQFKSSQDYPTDYKYDAIAQWTENFDGPWFATADVQFAADETSKTIPLQIVDNDNLYEQNENIIWRISDSAPFGFSEKTYTFSEDEANNQRNGIVDIELAKGSTIKTATITIKDNETCGLGFSEVERTVNENAGTATFTVTRTGSTNGEVTVKYGTSDGTAITGTDYTGTSGILTFGDGVTSQIITVPILNNQVSNESSKTINLTLTDPTGRAGLVGTKQTATLTIQDDDLSFTSTNVPQPINDSSTVTSDLVVGNVPGALTDVNLMLNISHTWDADLDVFLTSPTGTRVELFQDVGGTGDNLTNTTLDDQAATSISLGAAPFTGSFQPQGLLSALNGQDPNGTWRLEITDDSNGDVGTLNNWSLNFSRM